MTMRLTRSKPAITAFVLAAVFILGAQPRAFGTDVRTFSVDFGPTGVPTALTYDLGTVVVRAAIRVDPVDTHLTIDSDPLPTILEGIPLRLQFSGMISYRDMRDQLQIARIPLTTEAVGQLPLALVRSLRNRYYPGTAWLRMPRAAFERLIEYKRKTGLPSWEGAFDRLLDATEEANRITKRVR